MCTLKRPVYCYSDYQLLHIDLYVFQGGRWICNHIDDLHPTKDNLPPLAVLQQHSVSQLFQVAVKHAEKGGCLNSVEEEMDVETRELGDVAEVMDVDERVSVASADDATTTVMNTQKKLVCEGLRYSRHLLTGDGEVLDVDGIIRKCIHPALVMLKDSELSQQRTSVRLELLLSLLDDSNQESFGMKIAILVHVSVHEHPHFSTC